MPDNKDQLYIRIAQACLRAINSAADSQEERDKQVQAVYDAIDRAFLNELRIYQNDIADLTATLEKIARGNLNAEEAQSVAAEALSAPSRTQGGSHH